MENIYFHREWKRKTMVTQKYKLWTDFEPSSPRWLVVDAIPVIYAAVG